MVCCSGDNPNALVGLGLQPGDVAVSLGTSDTLMGVMSTPSPKTDGHVMCHAGEPDTYFAMLVYKNGDVVRRHVRDAYCAGDWREFSRVLRESRPGNDGTLLLGVLAAEITPPISALGFHKQDAAGQVTCDEAPSSAASGGGDEGAKYVRGIVEARFLSMAARAAALGLAMPPRRVLVAGGASSNLEILEVLADVFSAPVLVDSGADSASLGAALRAMAAVSPHLSAALARGGKEEGRSEVTRESCNVVATPRAEFCATYQALLPRIIAFENSLV